MSFATERDKALPDIPLDVDPERAVAEDGALWIATPANTNKALPSIRVESTLSEEEMRRLHELWNGAGLSARAHRRKRRGQNSAPRRIPPPISIPEPEQTLPTLSTADLTTSSTIPSTSRARKRWGFLTARPFSERQEAERRTPNTLQTQRAKAQNRLKKKLRYAKSAPNLSEGTPGEEGIELEFPVPIPTEATPKDAEPTSPPASSSPGMSAAPVVVLQPEDMDENAIYFTTDWRVSQGSVQFLFVTPVPDSPTSLGRPDSPLLHRHYSLDQLSYAAEQTPRALASMEFPDAYPIDEALRLIDELHTCLD